MRKVLFDSSFLMSVSEHPTDWLNGITDVLGRFEPVILDCVKEELAVISSGVGKKARLARLALQLSSDFSVESCGRAEVDDELMSSALGSGAAVATVDRALTGSLRAMHVDVVGLRSGRVMLK